MGDSSVRRVPSIISTTTRSNSVSNHTSYSRVASDDPHSDENGLSVSQRPPPLTTTTTTTTTNNVLKLDQANNCHRRRPRRERVGLLRADSEKTANGPPTDPDIDYVNIDEEDQMQIFGYRPHRGMAFFTWILVILSLFLLRLVFHWKPSWMLFMTNVRCSLANAHKVLLVDQYSQIFVEPVVIMTSTECISVVEDAQDKGGGVTVVVKDVQMNSHHCSPLVLPDQDGRLRLVDSMRYFINKKIKYIWSYESGEFIKLRGLDSVSCSHFYQNQQGLGVDEQDQRRLTFGVNNIEVPATSILTLLFMEILTPFYVFQMFSVLLWYFDNYYYYATCILIMSTFSVTVTVIQSRKNEDALRNTIQSSDVVLVCRGKDVYESVSSDQLVPGDVIAIPNHGCMMHCDAVLISGNCIVNESMLTGESVPVTKTPIPQPKHRSAAATANVNSTAGSNNVGAGQRGETQYDSKEHAKHTLFCGTKVIQTRYYGRLKVRAIVIRTGFMTAKGELVRSIMFPKPVDFKFHRDSLNFIGLLFSIAFIGFIYTIVRKLLNGATAKEIVLDAFDLITIAVPPALPAAMTAGIAYAQSRLSKQDIYCISPRSINISGCINCVCFDKTGTLTEDGLDMWGVLPAKDARFLDVVKEVNTLPVETFLIGMASCHSLSKIDGQLSGDPLDLKMFEATNWVLEEPDIDETNQFDNITPTVVKPSQEFTNQGSIKEVIAGDKPPFEVGIIRQFTFSSSLQRMSVVTRVLSAKNFESYTKGSPEIIASLSAPHTVPPNFTDVLMQYTRKGYRVLAIASKSFTKNYAKMQRVSREEVESNLTFLGLLVMENRLKPETTKIIGVLKRAEIRAVMITGDNMLTALSVARDCGLIDKAHKVILVNVVKSAEEKIPAVQFIYAEMFDQEVEEVGYLDKDRTEVVIEQLGERFHFAITGKAFAVIKDYFPELMPKLVVRGTVFARMSPDQKQQLVEQLQDLGFYVAMCGDGANDCGALKTAHAGISLSETEASVASPFTSKTPNIACVPTLIREGRTAMTTSFGIFKYMACYSLTQFASVIILYEIDCNLSDFEFLYIDLFLITIYAAFFGRTESYGTLVKQPPPSSLIGLTPLASLFSQLIIVIAFQVFAFYFVMQQTWFTPFIYVKESFFEGYENYAVFAVSSFQYITLVICFSKGAPYRKTIISNRFFLASIIITTALTIYVVIEPFEWLRHLLQLKMPPDMGFRWLMVAIAAINFLLCMLCERYFVNVLIFKLLQEKWRCLQPVSLHTLVEQEITNCPEWPPVSSDVDIGSIPFYTNSPTPASSPADVGDNSSDEETQEDDNKDESLKTNIDGSGLPLIIMPNENCTSAKHNNHRVEAQGPEDEVKLNANDLKLIPAEEVGNRIANGPKSMNSIANDKAAFFSGHQICIMELQTLPTKSIIETTLVLEPKDKFS